jgi:hypothetical protein
LLLAIRGLGRGVFGVPHRGPPLGAAAGRRLWFADWGWIAAGLPHRTWVDPFVVADNLPIKPRLVSFGDGPAIFRSLWRRLIFRRMGGVMPIWPGGGRAAVDAHLSAASQQPPDRGNTPPPTAGPILAAHQATELPEGSTTRWRWLTTAWR